MRIAAINIPNGYLPHVFGDNHDEITINLGGINLYEFEENKLVDIKKNDFYLDDIFSQNGISQISCIVGNNGSGKTSLMQLIANSYHCIYVLEYEDGTYNLTNNVEEIHRIYYTPYLHHKTVDVVRNNGKDLSKFAMITLDNHGDSGQLQDFLKSHNSENIKRWIKFNNFYKQLDVKKINLPTFQNVRIEMNHFNIDVHGTNKFYQTSEKLRPPLKQIFNKIVSEQEYREIEVFNKEELSDDEKEEIGKVIRFEYDLYELALGKFVNVLERRGNRYLQEGFIPDSFENEIGKRNVRDSIVWFLSNAEIRASKTSFKFTNQLALIDLIDYIMEIVDYDLISDDNWRHIIVSEAKALEIITLYDRFNESCSNDWFKFDTTPMFAFIPDIVSSSGEQGFLDLFSTLYFHSQNIERKIDIDFHSSNSLAGIGKNILLLIDEGDNAFHPQWKKEYVKYLREILPLIFKDKTVQIIITSHDPLTLSDFAKNNVVFIERVEKFSQILDSSNKRTLGANISDLLKDSFFIHDGQIGSFISNTINSVIEVMAKKKMTEVEIIIIERLIACLDEPILKFKLAEMLSEATGDKGFESKMIDAEMNRLADRRKRL